MSIKCRKRFIEMRLIFHPSKLHRREYVETTSKFRPSTLRWKKSIKTMSIFHPSKLCRRMYVETTSIFRPSKLHQKIRRSDVEIFRYFVFDVISTSNRSRLRVLCPLGSLLSLVIFEPTKK